jgi:phosphoribulokinase
MPDEDGNRPDHLDAELMLREGLPHPDLDQLIGDGSSGITMEEHENERLLRIPGDLDPDTASEIEEGIWDKLHFATHLRSQRLGEFTIGTDLHRSESLAVVQLLILYHLVSARAATALGGDGTRPPKEDAKEPEPASDSESDVDVDAESEYESESEETAAAVD